MLKSYNRLNEVLPFTAEELSKMSLAPPPLKDDNVVHKFHNPFEFALIYIYAFEFATNYLTYSASSWCGVCSLPNPMKMPPHEGYPW